jgi:hypothetical protein
MQLAATDIDEAARRLADLDLLGHQARTDKERGTEHQPCLH